MKKQGRARHLLTTSLVVVLTIATSTVVTLELLKQAFPSTSHITQTTPATNSKTSNTEVNYDAIDPTKIPLGDGKVSSEAQVGYTYSCTTTFRGGGARHAGDWIDDTNKTWNATTKVSVQGAVGWPTASSTISSSGATRTLTTNSLPKDQTTGIFPIARSDPAYQYDTNPNAIRAQSLTYSVPLNPVAAATPQCTPMGPIGVMLDGVILFNSLDDAGRDAVAHETQDSCDGHPSGREIYHYHDVSSCTLKKTEASSTLVGYALDGFGIYVEKDSSGNLPNNNDLDECHGRNSSVLWNGKQTTIYHYVATIEYPYTVGCFRGTPVTGNP